MTPADRPTITPEMVGRFAAYYAKNATWGSLHAVLDEGCVENKNVEWAVNYAHREGDTEGEELAKILLVMTRSQRGRIGRRAEALVDRVVSTEDEGPESGR